MTKDFVPAGVIANGGMFIYFQIPHHLQAAATARSSAMALRVLNLPLCSDTYLLTLSRRRCDTMRWL